MGQSVKMSCSSVLPWEVIKSSCQSNVMVHLLSARDLRDGKCRSSGCHRGNTPQYVLQCSVRWVSRDCEWLSHTASRRSLKNAWRSRFSISSSGHASLVHVVIKRFNFLNVGEICDESGF
jgi:hypothetical protein